MQNQTVIANAEEIKRTIERLAYEILEHKGDCKKLALLGIQRRGVVIAARIREVLEKRLGHKLPFGELDINLYRDDWTTLDSKPVIGPTNIPFDLSQYEVLLVDDVLFTGRTVRAALEALGDHGRLFDFEQIDRVADVIRQLHETGAEIAIVIGAGNIWRGRQGPAAKMTAVNADHMGMLGTAINSIAMQDAVERQGIASRVMSAVEMTRFCEPYTYRRAVRHLEKGRVVIFACGTGNPFFSTDTAAALRAVEIGADAILLAKNVDGVYDSDPRVNPEAKLLRDITYQEVQERDLKVMDASAITICRENKVPCIRVFGLDDPQNILRVIEGDMMGTVVHP